MSTFVRASKFRHVFCEHPRMDATFQNLRLSTVTGEQNYIKANPLFFAVGVQVGYSKNPGIFWRTRLRPLSLSHCLTNNPLPNHVHAHTRRAEEGPLR